jgi:predicted naringenin-chalcone synthase
VLNPVAPADENKYDAVAVKVHREERQLTTTAQEQSAAVTAAINAAAAATQAELDFYLVNTVAFGLPDREFWNPRQPDVYDAIQEKLSDVENLLDIAKHGLEVRVSNQITHVINEAQAKAHLAAAQALLTTNRQCETAAELNGCPIGRVKYL